VAVGPGCAGEVRAERQDDSLRPSVPQPAPVRGRGEEHRGQGGEGDEHGEDAQGALRDLDHDGVRAPQAPTNWHHAAADQRGTH